MLPKVALYLRISSDRTGEQAGVQRQERECRKLLAAHDWHVDEAHVYVDNDLSAYQQKKPRPDYDRMINAIKRGEIDTVVTWHIDRLYRNSRELQDLLEVIKPLDVTIHTVLAGPYDLSTPDGILRAEIGASIGQYESAIKSERIKAKLAANAAEGKHHGGRRAYGWKNDRVTLDPAEAAVVRKMADMVLAGDSCMSIARTLNDLGYPTTTGKKNWTGIVVRATLLRPRNVGLRVHHGEIIGKGQWEPILDRETWDRVCVILTDPARVTTPGRNGQIHLLSTVARCGVCGNPLIRGQLKGRTRKGTPRIRYLYRCHEGHVGRNQAKLDAFIERLIIERLRRPDAVRALLSDENNHQAREVSEKITALEKRLDEASEAFAKGGITSGQLTTISVAIREQIREARHQLATVSREDTLADLIEAEDPSEAWERLSPERRRAVVRVLMDITVHPSRKGPHFDYSTIEINWR